MFVVVFDVLITYVSTSGGKMAPYVPLIDHPIIATPYKGKRKNTGVAA